MKCSNSGGPVAPSRFSFFLFYFLKVHFRHETNTKTSLHIFEKMFLCQKRGKITDNNVNIEGKTFFWLSEIIGADRTDSAPQCLYGQ